jgi:hypothetical protein
MSPVWIISIGLVPMIREFSRLGAEVTRSHSAFFKNSNAECPPKIDTTKPSLNVAIRLTLNLIISYKFTD